MRNCKNVRDICPTSKLCPPCDIWWKDHNKRLDSQDRQQSARDKAHNQNRNIGSPTSVSDSPPPPHPPQTVTAPASLSGSRTPSVPLPSARPPAPNAAHFPPMGATQAPPPPVIDITSLQNSHNQAKASSAESPLSM